MIQPWEPDVEFPLRSSLHFSACVLSFISSSSFFFPLLSPPCCTLLASYSPDYLHCPYYRGDSVSLGLRNPRGVPALFRLPAEGAKVY